MRSIQGKTCLLNTYFITENIEDNGSFDFYGTNVDLIQTVHVVDNRKITPSYGIMFDADELTVFISGDAQSNPNQMMHFYEKADVIFHDCEFKNYPQSVHAQFHELCRLPEKIKRKMYLYHYDLNGQTYEQLVTDVYGNQFKGLVKRGQVFDTTQEMDFICRTR